MSTPHAGAALHRTPVDAPALVALALPWLAALLLPAFAQPASYHDFADQRALLGVPHALNILSNLPFLLVGALGLAGDRTLRLRTAGGSVAWPWRLFFAGTLLTAFGSAWYHARPDDASLVWDRLPIALGFGGLVAGALADRAVRRAQLLAVAFPLSGVATVLVWAGTGNLVPYLAMQVTFIGAALYVTARVPSHFSHAGWLPAAAAVYGLAVVCEHYDRMLHAATGGAISGHTAKHLLAALAIALVYAMLRRRRLATGSA